MGVISNGTTLLDAGALDGGVAIGDMIPTKTLTASSSGTLSFVDGASNVVLDGTYKEYIFKFINIHPQTDNVQFHFNVSIDSGSNYNVAKSTTFFEAAHNEGDTDAFLDYASGRDLAQGTGFQLLGNGLEQADVADENNCGFLHLFDPSSTTFVKNFLGSSIATSHNGKYAWNSYFAGYANTTSAVDAVQFKMSSGNIDAGIIKLYGIK